MGYFNFNSFLLGGSYILLSVAAAEQITGKRSFHPDTLNSVSRSRNQQDTTKNDGPRWGTAPAKEPLYSSNPFHPRAIAQLFKRSCQVIEPSGKSITCPDVCCPGSGDGGWCCDA